jgi:long-chain acyl-CoA synthetase
MTCYEELKSAYEKFGDTYALYFFGSKTNISEFIKHVDILAAYFTKNNIQKGNCFTVYLPNCIQSFAVFYALNKIGVIANIVHPLTPLASLKETLINTKSQGVIALDILITNQVKEINELNTTLIIAKTSDYLKGFKKPFFKIYEFFKARKVKRLNNAIYYNTILKHEKNSVQYPVVNNTKSIAVYIHSGGTSGENKTIKLSNFAITSLSNQLAAINTRTGAKFTPIVLPMFHAYGLAACMHNALIQGYSGIVFPKFNAKAINKAIIKYDISVIISVPLMIAKMMQQKNFYGKHLQKLETVFCGGDTVGTALSEEFNAAVAKHGGEAKLLAGYGLTECCSVVSVNTNENYRFGSVGKPLPNVDINILNEDKQVVPANTIGEIAVYSPTNMNGYLNSKNSGLTKLDGKDWVLTGDLGFFDDNGFLYIIGRKKRLIKIASYNIFPSHIEDLVSQLPYVNEVCAIETVKQNKKIVKLVLSLKNTDIPRSKISEEIFKHCSENLIKYSVPSELEIIDQLPHTPLGKIDFVKINNLYN